MCEGSVNEIVEDLLRNCQGNVEEVWSKCEESVSICCTSWESMLAEFLG